MMGWEIWLQLIARVGIPTAASLWTKWQAGGEPTAADWDELRALGEQTPVSIMKKALIAKGIDPESDEGKKWLALVGG